MKCVIILLYGSKGIKMSFDTILAFECVKGIIMCEKHMYEVMLKGMRYVKKNKTKGNEKFVYE